MNIAAVCIWPWDRCNDWGKGPLLFKFIIKNMQVIRRISYFIVTSIILSQTIST